MVTSLVSFHPEKALFPPGCVLRVFPRACPAQSGRRTHIYASAKTPARHRERSGEAGGLVRPCPEKKALLSELETYLLPITLKDYFRMGTI